MPTLMVRINWSESKHVNQSGLVGKFHPIEKVNKVLSRAAQIVMEQDGGYDKTIFNLRVVDGESAVNEYQGMIDLGHAQEEFGSKIVQGHIINSCEYFTSGRCPDYMLVTGEEAEELNWWKAVMLLW